MATLALPKNCDRPIRPQFNLRGLFALMTGMAALFAVMGTVGPIGSTGILLVLALVGLHVAGNALGTSLRQTASSPVDRPVPIPSASSLPRPNTPRLCERTPLSRIIPMASALGAVGGCVLGTIGLQQWTDAQAPGLVLGSISFGVLGALFGFLAGSFLEIALCAWWQATAACSATSTSAQRRSLPGALPLHIPAALVADIDAG